MASCHKIWLKKRFCAMDFHVKEGKKGLSATKSSEGKPFVQIFIMSRRTKSGYLPQNLARESPFANIYHVLKEEKWIFATEFGERGSYNFHFDFRRSCDMIVRLK